MSDMSSRIELGLLTFMSIVAAPVIIVIFLPFYLMGWVVEKLGKLLGFDVNGY